MTINVFNLKINDVLSALNHDYLEIYRSGEVEDLIQEFNSRGAISSLSVNCPDFSLNFDLKTNLEDSHQTDLENIRILYENMKNLPPSIASKPEFWAYLAHAFHADYVHYRSECARINYKESDVLRDFFCQPGNEPPRRAVVVNLLSRLWWAGRLTYDDANQEDPYHFTKLLTSSAFNSKLVLLASSTVTNNHDNMMGLLEAVEQFKHDCGLEDISRREILCCTKHLNAIGAVRMVDALGRTNVRDLCLGELKRNFE